MHVSEKGITTTPDIKRKNNTFVIEKEPTSVVAESYRTLRTNIEYSLLQQDLKTIVVTSSEPGEGKTTTAGNLALSLAQNEKRVLLIDCDLRRGTIHNRFQISNKEGLSEIIGGKVSLKDGIRSVAVNLDIITTGNLPQNPSEMLGSKNMKFILNKLRDSYDYIILDTPPVLVVTDGQILSSRADGTILVVRAEKTKRDNVINAKNLLDKVKANIIGTVLNGTKLSESSYYYYKKDEKRAIQKVKKKRLSLSFGK